MPEITLKISRTHAQLLTLLGKHIGRTGGPTAVLEELLDRLDDGVFRSGSWERAIVTQLFGRGWEQELEREDRYRFRLAGPRNLCVDAVGDTDTVMVFRFAVPTDGVPADFDGDVELAAETDDWLTHARKENPLSQMSLRLVFHVHPMPDLAAWLRADAIEEAAGRPPLPASQAVLDDWSGLLEYHAVTSEPLACGLPPVPERGLRDPRAA